jgi:hypothetical protein
MADKDDESSQLFDLKVEVVFVVFPPGKRIYYVAPIKAITSLCMARCSTAAEPRDKHLQPGQALLISLSIDKITARKCRWLIIWILH